MDALVPVVAVVLSWLRGVLRTDVCPGDWAWAITAFGLLVGLLPAAAAVAGAWLRRLGAPLGAVCAFAALGAGLLPWLAFAAIGELFRRAADGSATGLSRADRLSLDSRVCLGVTQGDYLGAVPVTDALSADAVRAGLFFTPLVLFPLLVLPLVWLQGRLALRRGARRAITCCWLPVPLIAVTTATMPAGSTAQLWSGVVFGALGGVFAVPVLRPPGSGRPAPVRPAPARQIPAGSAPVARRPVTDRPGRGPAPSASTPALAARLARVRHAAEERIRAARGQSVPAAHPDAGPGHPNAGVRVQDWMRGAPDRMRARIAPPEVAEPPARSAVPPRVAGPPAPPVGFVVPAPRPGAMPAGAMPTPRAGAGPAGAVPVVPAPRPPGTLIGPPAGVGPRFELIRQLGVGGFGGVWLAVDHHRGHQVALKAAHAPDPDTEQRIRREARALGAVRHPNCVSIFDLIDSRSDPGLSRLHGLVIVMDYLKGRTLDDLVRGRGPMDDVTAAMTWSRLADALDAAHRHGVLHRDVKPGNVLVDPAGRPHLIDFGIARARGDATLTMHGFVLGTPDYLAPEVARGEPASPASDSWQLAATMSFALTGWPPRGGHQNAGSGLRAAAAGAPLSHLPTGGALRDMLCAGMAEAPGARPSLTAIRAVLDRWVAAVRTAGPARLSR